MHHRTYLGLALGLALILAACGGGGGGGGGGGLDLSQSFEQNGLSLKYPAGWVIVDDSWDPSIGDLRGVMLVNNQGLMGTASALDPETQGTEAVTTAADLLVIGIVGIPTSEVREGATATALAEELSNDMAGGMDFSAVTEVTVGGKSGARRDGQDEAIPLAYTYIVLNVEGHFVGIIGITGKGALANWTDEIDAIAGTISFKPS